MKVKLTHDGRELLRHMSSSEGLAYCATIKCNVDSRARVVAATAANTSRTRKSLFMMLE